MANFGEFIAGAYTGTFDAIDLGPTEQGFTLKQSLLQEDISESDQYGQTLIDFIYRGGNCAIQCDCKEYKAGTRTPFWPWAAFGQLSTNASPIGRRASDVAEPLVLTSTSNTPAATKPTSLTATYAAPAPNFSGDLLFNSKLRRVPIMLQLLPYTGGTGAGSIVWFITT
jgi:hypothetical protein